MKNAFGGLIFWAWPKKEIGGLKEDSVETS